MTDQINAFESDPTVNESGRRKIIMGEGILAIRGRGTISVKLPQSQLRLHNALFVLNLSVNLISASRIITKDFYAVHDYRDYAVINNSDNKLMFKAERLDNERL